MVRLRGGYGGLYGSQIIWSRLWWRQWFGGLRKQRVPHSDGGEGYADAAERADYGEGSGAGRIADASPDGGYGIGDRSPVPTGEILGSAVGSGYRISVRL